MTTELSIDQLAAELERRRREQEAEQQRQADILREAQKEWSADLLKVHKAMSQQLEAEGNAAMAAAEAAISDGDLTTAYFNYTGWHASRSARYHLNSTAQSAANRVDFKGYTIPDFRIVDSDFGTWLNQQVHRLADRDGAARFEELMGAEIPTSYEEAAAWLEANRGN